MGLYYRLSLLRQCKKERTSRIRNTYKARRRHGRFRTTETSAVNITSKTQSILLKIMKLYVPNPQTWVDFFQRVSSSKTSRNQTGSGRRPRVIPVIRVKPEESKHISIKAVLPAEQTTAQAKSELERQDINSRGIVNTNQSNSGRARKRMRSTLDEKAVKRQKKPVAVKRQKKSVVKVIRKKDVFDQDVRV